jgi:hypothetical protein
MFHESQSGAGGEGLEMQSPWQTMQNIQIEAGLGKKGEKKQRETDILMYSRKYLGDL